MRSGAIALCGGFVMLASSAFAQTTPSDANAQIEQCIRQNAPKVEAAIRDLKQGVSFLIEDVCAVPVSLENARQMRARTAATTAQWQRLCDDGKDRKDGDAQSKNQNYFCSMAKVNGVVGGAQYVQDIVDDGTVYTGQASPAMISLASSLLLDLRLAHLKSEAPH
jgi:hypothetical protein